MLFPLADVPHFHINHARPANEGHDEANQYHESVGLHTRFISDGQGLYGNEPAQEQNPAFPPRHHCREDAAVCSYECGKTQPFHCKRPLTTLLLNAAENIRAEFASSAAIFDLCQDFVPFAVEGTAQSNIIGSVVCTEHGAFRIYTADEQFCFVQ